jgi:hypothetical protein
VISAVSVCPCALLRSTARQHESKEAPLFLVPRWDWTCRDFRPPITWWRRRNCARAPSSPGPGSAGKTGKGNPYLKGALGEAAAAAAKTDTFLGERYWRIVKRRGKLKALVAVACSIVVIVWHLLADPTAHFRDLGPDWHTTCVVTQRKIRDHIAQLTALGYRVTLGPAA